MFQSMKQTTTEIDARNRDSAIVGWFLCAILKRCLPMNQRNPPVRMKLKEKKEKKKKKETEEQKVPVYPTIRIVDEQKIRNDSPTDQTMKAFPEHPEQIDTIPPAEFLLS